MANDIEEKQKRFYQATGFMLCETQRIERLMKVLLGFLKYDGTSDLSDSFNRSNSELDKKSLGLLLNVFRQKSDMNSAWDKTFQDFLDNRNTFAHHLIEQPDFNNATLEGLEAGLVFLKNYRKSMLLVESMLVPMLTQILMVWLKAFYSDAPDDPLKQQIVALRERLDTVNKILAEEFNLPVTDHHELIPEDGAEDFHKILKMTAIIDAVNSKSLDKLKLEERVVELWEQQEIIIVLKEIGMSYADNRGWAALSDCGRLLKQEYPDIKPEDYGLEDYGYEELSVLLEVSDVFEMRKENTSIYFRPVRNIKKLN